MVNRAVLRCYSVYLENRYIADTGEIPQARDSSLQGRVSNGWLQEFFRLLDFRDLEPLDEEIHLPDRFAGLGVVFDIGVGRQRVGARLQMPDLAGV